MYVETVFSRVFISFLFLFGFSAVGFAQVTITGTCVDDKTGDPIIGATIVLQDHSGGAASGENGEFKLKVPSLPATALVSFAGYTEKTVTFTKASGNEIRLKEDAGELEEFVVKAERISEKEKEEPLTVESIGLNEIKEVSSATFYESLGNLKGVDITSASLGFRVINTRGFNSTSPVRSLQLIDGVDNQSPGLNFSLGNFLGASDLDVKKVDLIAGASSAFFGPNAFNGVINMQTKDPFIHRGLDVQLKAGERSLGEVAFRFADVISNSKGREVFGYKINLMYFSAMDWKATNYAPTSNSEAGQNNPGGYDAINVYGDEDPEPTKNYTEPIEQYEYPGLGIFYRNGYKEADLVNYNTENLKTNIALHYRFKDTSTLIYAFNGGGGSTVYQGDNRYRLQDIRFWQNRLELRKENKYFLRLYSTQEDAGTSYDIVSTGVFLNNASTSDAVWNTAYKTSWRLSGFKRMVENLDGYKPWNPQDKSLETWVTEDLEPLLAFYRDSLVKWHGMNRELINQSVSSSKEPRYELGTARFDSLYNDIISRKFNQGGTRFFDKSALYHIHGEYIFRPDFGEIRVGGNGRLYRPNSDGTIFKDTGDVVITNYEFGMYAGLEKHLYNKRLKVNATTRVDKNQNFNFLFSPAMSAVYKWTTQHVLRLSLSSAIRNPTLADQYLYYNVGRAILLGNLNGYDSLISLSSFSDYRNTLQLSDIHYFNVAPIKPEKVRSVEIGYKGTLLDKSLYIDGSYYFSLYRDFIGYVIGLETDFDPNTRFPVGGIQAYRLAANATNTVTTQGFSVAISYYHKNLAYTANYSWNVLNKKGTDDPIIPAFNTPKHKFNIGVNGRKLKFPGIKGENFGFGVNYKWVDGFNFTGSPQFTGYVPRYDMLDAQVNYRIEKIHCLVKVGGSNLIGLLPIFNDNNGTRTVFNNRNYQVYGGPYIGRLAYVSLLFELHDLSLHKKSVSN